MCFSPTVSFTAAALLAGAGALTFKKAGSRKEMLFAAVPLLFAAQQFTEGLLWLSLLSEDMEAARRVATQIYIAFVGILWPVLMPLSIYVMEPNPMNRRLIMPVIVLGTAIAVYTLNLIIHGYVVADIVESCCIIYNNALEPGEPERILYLVATCTAFFLSSYKIVRMLGLANLAAFLVAYYFYEINFASIWCFFAAFMSTLIYFYLDRVHQKRLALKAVKAS